MYFLSFVWTVKSLKPTPGFQFLSWPSCLENGRSKEKFSQSCTEIVCPKALLTDWSCSGKSTAFCQKGAVPCETLHRIRGIFTLWACCVVGPTCAVSITLRVTKCPWLDLVGICKPRDSRRGVCGRRGSRDALTQEWFLGSGKRWPHKEPCWLRQRQDFLWGWRSASPTRSGKQRDSRLQVPSWLVPTFLQPRF